MEHLKLEDLARLVDEAPSPAEAEHLEACGRCSEELEALLGQTRMLATLPDPVPAAAIRRRIERELELAKVGPGRADGWRPALLRIAAGLALFVIGGAAGAFGVAPALDPRDDGPQMDASPRTVAEAAATLRAAESEYVQAVARYAELADEGEAVDPLNRLVALEGIVVTTEAALREAPADPVINNFHLTAVGQRDALLRQIQLVSNDDWF
jgi:hypothetical protein